MMRFVFLATSELLEVGGSFAISLACGNQSSCCCSITFRDAGSYSLFLISFMMHMV